MRTKDENDEYWFCYIGPVKKTRRPFGADLPLRVAVKDTFYNLVGHDALVCRSGFGLTKDQVDASSFATNSDELKQALIQSYYDENKPIPRHMRAWELLFEEEDF